MFLGTWARLLVVLCAGSEGWVNALPGFRSPAHLSGLRGQCLSLSLRHHCSGPRMLCAALLVSGAQHFGTGSVDLLCFSLAWRRPPPGRPIPFRSVVFFPPTCSYVSQWRPALACRMGRGAGPSQVSDVRPMYMRMFFMRRKL